MDDNISNLNINFSPLEPVRCVSSLKSQLPNKPPIINEDEDLIDFETTEVLQDRDEVASRIFHRTMNLLAPKHKSSRKKDLTPNPYAGRLEQPSPPRRIERSSKDVIVDPLPDFLAKFNSDFEAVMREAQRFRGELQVYAEFGRLILKNIHEKHIDVNKDPDKILNILQAGPWIFFTNKLTVMPCTYIFYHIPEMCN
jgi:hypothetical protein